MVRIFYGGIFVDYMDGQFQKNKSFGVIILAESCFSFLEWGVIFFIYDIILAWVETNL